MEFEKLFKVIVLGGSVIAGGCAPKTGSTPPAPDTTKAATKATDKDAVDCEKVCSGPEGRERFCPDPNQDGSENCCWLMGPEQHACCPQGPSLK